MLHRSALAFIFVVASMSCSRPQSSEAAAPALTEAAMRSRAVAILQPLQDSGVSGQIIFTQLGDGVQVRGTITGLGAGTPHGFHVHEYGDCTDPEGMSAGGHFDPRDEPHGPPHAEASHIGDLGNITANKDGVATVSMLKEGATVLYGKTAFVGRSVIVHAEPDDFVTQPTGAAGDRIACGVIHPEE